MRIVVDRTRCTALGNCEAVAPEYFAVDDDGVLELLRDDVDETDLAVVRRAVAGCPMAALALAD